MYKLPGSTLMLCFHILFWEHFRCETAPSGGRDVTFTTLNQTRQNCYRLLFLGLKNVPKEIKVSKKKHLRLLKKKLNGDDFVCS